MQKFFNINFFLLCNLPCQLFVIHRWPLFSNVFFFNSYNHNFCYLVYVGICSFTSLIFDVSLKCFYPALVNVTNNLMLNIFLLTVSLLKVSVNNMS